jgi:isopenicillin-N epimerase
MGTTTECHPEFARHWTLDPDVVFLNHGSFGACPRPVLEAQTRFRAQLEREPVRFFTRDAPALLAEARAVLGRFIGADRDGLAFVPNATHGINAVLRSLPVAPGDELIVTDHEYNASRNVLDYVAQERGARLVIAKIPFPIEKPEDVVAAVMACVTPRTRLALLDHVTSQTGLVLPIGELIRSLAERGVDVLVDGAHAPGMVPLDIAALAPAYYTGNCHKWLCAPKGAAFLWVREDLRPSVRPAIISHGANAPVPLDERFRIEFDWMGTTDPSAALCVPAAIEFMGGLLPGGWDEVRARNRALVLEGGAALAAVLGRARACPEAMVGSLLALPVPASSRFPAPGAENSQAGALRPDPLHEALFREYAVEVPILRCPAHPGRLVRISAQLYNRRADYEHLAEALAALL